MVTVDLSGEMEMAFKRDREMVMPSWMLELLAKAPWPPLLTAKGQEVDVARRMRKPIWSGVSGTKMQWGVVSCCSADQ